MVYDVLFFKDLSTKVSYSLFDDGEGVAEFHAMIELQGELTDAEAALQFENISCSVTQLFLQPFLINMAPVFQRWFVSDLVNQSAFIPANEHVATSVVQQPPLNGSKAALWLYGIEKAQIQQVGDNAISVTRPSYIHYFHTQMHETKGSAFEQTASVFGNYNANLSNLRCTLMANCIRTWLFVQNVDTQYAGMVEARNKVFDAEGLTSRTHYIASTGIEGRYKYPQSIILMDAYAISGLTQQQIRYLKGSTHLNPTQEYGVAFERGTAVQYGDRRHVFISGTASINNKGEILHPLDVELQTQRVIENIKVLLAEAQCDMQNIAQMIVYLRDIADYKKVNRYMQNNYPYLPTVIVLAPVCRPGWLIEMECIAVQRISEPRYPQF
ncbi:MAG: endoribonuclease family protein [Bacteroidetes bacterium]|nr:endoribonuclease family protein [Bacteroidota bacterium]